MSSGDSPDPGSRADRAASFEQGAAQYASTRPSYPDAAVDWLLPEGARRVLDLAAGTGKLTERLVTRGLDVVAVEPSDAMRTRLAASVPGAQALPGSAEAIPLPDARSRTRRAPSGRSQSTAASGYEGRVDAYWAAPCSNDAARSAREPGSGESPELRPRRCQTAAGRVDPETHLRVPDPVVRVAFGPRRHVR